MEKEGKSRGFRDEEELRAGAVGKKRENPNNSGMKTS